MTDQGAKNRVLIVGKTQQEKFVEGEIEPGIFSLYLSEKFVTT